MYFQDSTCTRYWKLSVSQSEQAVLFNAITNGSAIVGKFGDEFDVNESTPFVKSLDLHVHFIL